LKKNTKKLFLKYYANICKAVDFIFY